MLVIEMVKPSKGVLSGRTRKLRGKSRVSVAQSVRTFKVGDKVIIVPKSTHRGQPHLRYSNRHGIVVETRGKSYIVEVADYKKRKQLVVGPVHLKLAS
jgi:large subunit ribosomal protein L21e